MWQQLGKSAKGAAVVTLFFASSLVAETAIKFTDTLFQRLMDEFGSAAAARVKRWQTLLSDKRHQNEEEKLKRVNDFFNQVRFIDDQSHWQQQDYWATPVEFLAADGGDCEDFAIAKYFSLKALDVDEKKMRLMYVKALRLNQAHMVLAYYPTPDAIPLILDNLRTDIVPASQRPDLYPVYSFNGEGLWLAKAQGRGKKVQRGENHGLWQELTDRIERGF